MFLIIFFVKQRTLARGVASFFAKRMRGYFDYDATTADAVQELPRLCPSGEAWSRCLFGGGQGGEFVFSPEQTAGILDRVVSECECVRVNSGVDASLCM